MKLRLITAKTKRPTCASGGVGLPGRLVPNFIASDYELWLRCVAPPKDVNKTGAIALTTRSTGTRYLLETLMVSIKGGPQSFKPRLPNLFWKWAIISITFSWRAILRTRLAYAYDSSLHR
jgi:hypothetical protein